MKWKYNIICLRRKAKENENENNKYKIKWKYEINEMKAGAIMKRRETGYHRLKPALALKMQQRLWRRRSVKAIWRTAEMKSGEGAVMKMAKENAEGNEISRAMLAKCHLSWWRNGVYIYLEILENVSEMTEKKKAVYIERNLKYGEEKWSMRKAFIWSCLREMAEASQCEESWYRRENTNEALKKWLIEKWR